MTSKIYFKLSNLFSVKQIDRFPFKSDSRSFADELSECGEIERKFEFESVGASIINGSEKCSKCEDNFGEIDS
jgi:formylmethanofuran dehydrogenase subunit E